MKITLLSFFVLGFLAVTSSVALAAEVSCLIDRDAVPADADASKFVCVKPDKHGRLDLDFLEESSGSHIYIKDAFLTTINPEHVPFLKDSKINFLIVDGVCGGDCSRLLLPVSKKRFFTQGSFAVLTDSSIETRSTVLGIFLFEEKGLQIDQGFPLKEVKNFELNYQDNIVNKFARDINLLSATNSNLSHLNWHSFVRQSLVHSEGLTCIPIKKLGVVLTNEYLNSNGMKTNSYQDPTVSNILTFFRKRDDFDDWKVVYSYSFDPIHGCRRKY